MLVRISYEIDVPSESSDLSPILDAANEVLDAVVYNVESMIQGRVLYDQDNAACVEYVK
tara:strand:- start:598 stop:774 length:177 start_codon:yes stop_codon:yes gene_type:complete